MTYEEAIKNENDVIEDLLNYLLENEPTHGTRPRHRDEFLAGIARHTLFLMEAMEELENATVPYEMEAA
jgi:hypothetical protein